MRKTWKNEANIYQVHQGLIEAAAWSPGTQEVASCGVDGDVRVWNAETGGTCMIYQGHHDLVRTLAYSPNGCYLASGSEDGEVQVWEVTSGYLYRRFTGHQYSVLSLCWSPDGIHLASLDETVVYIWSMQHETEEPREVGRAEECILTALCWLSFPHGQCLFAASEGNVYCWNAHTGRLLDLWEYAESGETLIGMAASLNGRQMALATDDASVLITDALTGIRQRWYHVALDASWGLCWSPCGRYVASSGYQHVEIHNARSGETVYSYEEHTASIHAVVWSSDGQRIASLDGEGLVHVWHVKLPT